MSVGGDNKSTCQLDKSSKAQFAALAKKDVDSSLYPEQQCRGIAWVYERIGFAVVFLRVDMLH